MAVNPLTIIRLMRNPALLRGIDTLSKLLAHPPEKLRELANYTENRTDTDIVTLVMAIAIKDHPRTIRAITEAHQIPHLEYVIHRWIAEQFKEKEQ